MYVYGAPAYVLFGNKKRLVVKFFDAVCTVREFKHYLTTAYHS